MPTAAPSRGRFAPTPSGPLHLGSLLTAVASFLHAKARDGQWLLRIDDLDAQRCPPGTADLILRQLEGHGLAWDEAVRYQSQHVDDYRRALETLCAGGGTYRCRCTRAEVTQRSHSGPDGAVYSGFCRDRELDPGARHTTRFRVGDGRCVFHDGWQGLVVRDLGREVGDFILQRADGVPSYQLACAVDEARQRITDVVRGADLLGSTVRQLCIMAALDLPPPLYRHLPVVVGADGRKLSKQNHATPVDSARAGENLCQCLHLLGLNPPSALRTANPSEVLAWGIANWRPECVPAVPAIPYNASGAVQHPGYNAAQQSEEWLE